MSRFLSTDESVECTKNLWERDRFDPSFGAEPARVSSAAFDFCPGCLMEGYDKDW